MIGASKILTVSYGTFSCTLEGFDDPFNTMRAIAEYFRDLAAEDRYFGAEPPTPDAAMLHRIAEREINRRVEANIQENGVILRAGDIKVTRSAPAVMATGVVPAVVPTVSAPPEPAALAVGIADDSIATRLTRLREAQAEAERAAATPADATEEEIEAEPQAQTDVWSMSAEDTIASVMADLAASGLAEPEHAGPELAGLDLAGLDLAGLGLAGLGRAAPARANSEMGEPAVDAAAPLDLRPDPAAAETAAPDPDHGVEPASASSFAEAAAGEPRPDDRDDAEQPHAAFDRAEAGFVETPVRDAAFVDPGFAGPVAIARVLGDLTDVETSLAEPEPAATVWVAQASAEATRQAPVDPTANVAAADADLRTTLGAMIDPDGDDEFDPAPVAATVFADADAVADANDAAVADQADVPQDPVAQPDATLPTADPEDAAPASDPRVVDRLQRARARVIKIRRIDVAAATPGPDAAAPGAAVLTVAVGPTKAAAVETPASALSPEAEAELQRELADLEAALAPDAQTEPHDPEASAPHATRPAEQGPADDAVNRLISQTNAAMEGPENKRRLAAIAHLKAAVAATFAERKSNAAPAHPGPAERMDPYRDDLDRVVRPRRPALVAPSTSDEAAATPRPQADNRPAPLVLVSEQRIDRPAAAAVVAATLPVVPVRPRRVTTDLLVADTHGDVRTAAHVGQEDADALTEDDVNNIFADPTQPFADFAERLGAVTMPDLMEAAAAYCALQLGRDQFTRPLLLQQIADLPGGDEYNREDCLRGFGTLLRDGRIEKIKRGQFRLSGQSRYLAEAKRNAG